MAFLMICRLPWLAERSVRRFCGVLAVLLLLLEAFLHGELSMDDGALLILRAAVFSTTSSWMRLSSISSVSSSVSSVSSSIIVKQGVPPLGVALLLLLQGWFLL